jgi:hypothetical protein
MSFRRDFITEPIPSFARDVHQFFQRLGEQRAAN